MPEKIEYADGKEFIFGKTKIKFSQPVFHGTNPKLGYITEVLVDDGYKIIHTSDVEGPAVKEQVEFIIQNNPDIVFIDGPLTQMLGFRYSMKNLDDSVKNMIKIIKETDIEYLIIEHHMVRDLKWHTRISEVFEEGKKKNVKVITAAEYIGKEPELLEAHRKDLYKLE